MGLRIFVGSDGERWTAWTVRDDATGAPANLSAEWLAFQNDAGTERRRLLDVPADWEKIPEKSLDLLRQKAEPVALYLDRHSLPGGMVNVSKRPR